jgi:hypothetical protein
MITIQTINMKIFHKLGNRIINNLHFQIILAAYKAAKEDIQMKMKIIKCF